jgi:putative FmdB family regulatory protein
MPLYSFRCRECDREFTLVLSLDEHARRAGRCPRCGSKDIEQVIESVEVITGRKS